MYDTQKNKKGKKIMEVILLQNVTNLGPMGEVVKVKNGYARNYLLPKKQALRANKENKILFESQRSVLEAANLEKKAKYEGISKDLAKKNFSLIRAAGDTGYLYGSVSSRDIADLLIEEGFDVNRGQINLKSPIKSVGIHNIMISLHADVSTTITLNVARSTEEMVKQDILGEHEEEILS